jgi:hypothetical protein
LLVVAQEEAKVLEAVPEDLELEQVWLYLQTRSTQ